MDAPQDTSARLIRLSSLELTYRASTEDEDALKRRFMTLSVPEQSGSAWRGGVGYVVKATSLSTGEIFALKRLKERVSPRGGEEGTRAKKLAASFRREYDTHRVLSPTGLVPELVGWATLDGEPAILMEWVDGLTLHDAAKELRGANGEVPLTTVADIGISVLGALHRIELVDSSLVHRDLSPRNIMIRTGERSLREQMEAGIYDICLIDFGSATVEQDASSSFTVAENLWRGATPDYAPPEMLAHDLDNLLDLRRSSSIDVYALCSVLYELYAGHTPYDVTKRAERVPYQIKSTEPPREIEQREGDEQGVLAGAILGGLSSKQDERPTVEELSEELRQWEEAHGTTRPWEQTLDAQIESDTTAIPKTTASLSPTVLEVQQPPGRELSSGGAGVPRPGFWRRHRRKAIGCALIVVLLVVVVFAGMQTHWFGIEAPMPKASVNEYSWNDLSRISKRIGEAQDGNEAAHIESEYGLVNSEGELDFTQAKNVMLTDGSQARAVITGFRHDEKSDGSGRAGITFALAGLPDKRQMNSEKTKSRNWADTDLRAELNGSLLEELPADLRDSLVEVKKTSVSLTPSDGKGDKDISGIDDDEYYRVASEETNDSLWLYSDAETASLYVGDSIADALDLSESDLKSARYEIFSDRVLGAVVNEDTVAPEESATGQEESDADIFQGDCWLRTPSEYGSDSYETTGDSGMATCTAKRVVVPGFCI